MSLLRKEWSMRNIFTILAAILISTSVFGMNATDAGASEQVYKLTEVENAKTVMTAARAPHYYSNKEIFNQNVSIKFKSDGYYGLKRLDLFNALPETEAWKKMSEQQKKVCEIERKFLDRPDYRHYDLESGTEYPFLSNSREDTQQLVMGLVEFLDKYREETTARLTEEIAEREAKLKEKEEELAKYQDMKVKAEEGKIEEKRKHFRDKDSSVEILTKLQAEESFAKADAAGIAAKIDAIERLIDSKHYESMSDSLREQLAGYRIEKAGLEARIEQLGNEIEKIKVYLRLDDDYATAYKKIRELENNISDIKGKLRNDREHKEKIEPIISEDYFITVSNLKVKIMDIAWREE